jgi:hypothetical protein
MSIPFPYPSDIEQCMKVLYRSLRENDRRRYAATEAERLGHGGLDYIAGLLGCDPKTIRQGQEDLKQLREQTFEDIGPRERVRKKGVDADLPSKRSPN